MPNICSGETLQINNYIKEPVAGNLVKLSNHIKRYHDGMRKLDLVDNSVIDVSCGTGFGSYMLAQCAWRVIGLDINESYLSIARELFKKNNLEFHNINDFNGSSSQLVCIETIEHIHQSKLNGFIEKILSFCSSSIGRMFLTVPLGNNEPSKYNKFHLNEPSIDVLYKLFNPYFANIEIKTIEYINSFGHVVDECQLTLSGRK